MIACRNADSALACSSRVSTLLLMERLAMTCTHFAEGKVLFREGDTSDCVFRLLSGAVDILRELDGEPILLGRVGAGQFIGEMGVVENRPRSATARAASEGRGGNPRSGRILRSDCRLTAGRTRIDPAAQSAA